VLILVIAGRYGFTRMHTLFVLRRTRTGAEHSVAVTAFNDLAQLVRII
jgi:hypothetical protein